LFQLEQERHMADNLVSAMQPKLRDRYVELKNKNIGYQVALEKMNQELDSLNSRYSKKISIFPKKSKKFKKFKKFQKKFEKFLVLFEKFKAIFRKIRQKYIFEKFEN
jgi:uncharacterized protein YsxB (DUF464 family)